MNKLALIAILVTVTGSACVFKQEDKCYNAQNVQIRCPDDKGDDDDGNNDDDNDGPTANCDRTSPNYTPNLCGGGGGGTTGGTGGTTGGTGGTTGGTGGTNGSLAANTPLDAVGMTLVFGKQFIKGTCAELRGVDEYTRNLATSPQTSWNDGARLQEYGSDSRFLSINVSGLADGMYTVNTMAVDCNSGYDLGWGNFGDTAEHLRSIAPEAREFVWCANASCGNPGSNCSGRFRIVTRSDGTRAIESAGTLHQATDC